VKPVSKNDVPANGVEAELQRRDYAEVAASSPEHPEQVRVLGCARRHETPVRSDHLCADQAVGGEPMLAPPSAGPDASKRERRISGCLGVCRLGGLLRLLVGGVRSLGAQDVHGDHDRHRYERRPD
jgi:hypothetical protein